MGRQHSKSGRMSGFTLLELMFALGIMVLLGAIAVPGYRAIKTRIDNSNAIADLNTLSLSLKRWELNRGRLPDTLAEAGLDGLVDPWGRPYEYLNLAGANPGQMRKDKNLVPINTDFDLYSMGKDGLSRPPLTAKHSQDDIVRANDGGYIGLAAGY